MKKPFLIVAGIAFALAGNLTAQFVSLENPPDMSNGSYEESQHFVFDGNNITWGLGLTPGPSFFVQATEDMFDPVYLNFGEWNGAPYEVTSDPLSFNASVVQAPSWQGQRQTSGPAITEQYFGIRYNTGPGNYNYGWINLSTISASQGGLIHAVAFNTTANADILAGQTVVPEPREVAILMVIALIVLILFRRSRVSRVV